MLRRGEADAKLFFNDVITEPLGLTPTLERGYFFEYLACGILTDR